MTKSAVVRTIAAASLVAHGAVALASEAAVEGQGELGGINALIYLVGGVAGMGVVIWLLLKFMNRNG
jgi:formate-dependent nitrite reductase membrane component NrfD